MYLNRLVRTIALLLGVLLSASGANASPSAAVTESDGNRAAKALLDRAVAHYKTVGEAAFAAFSRAGEFLSGDRYVYVLGRDGVLQASGGSSITLLGRDISALEDSDGKAFIREILTGARNKGSGSVKYRWRNPLNAKVLPKIAYYEKVGDVIIVVGHYILRASPELAQSMLWRAVHELKNNPETAIRSFNDINGGFLQDDLYVFVVGINDMTVYAHGSQPRLIGKNVADLHDQNGKAFIKEMIHASQEKEIGEVQYTWINPVTKKTEKKISYVKRVGEYLVGVGAYAND